MMKPVYSHTLAEQLAKKPEIKQWVEVMCVRSGEEALVLIEDDKFDTVVLDIDLGRDRLNGFRGLGPGTSVGPRGVNLYAHQLWGPRVPTARS